MTTIESKEFVEGRNLYHHACKYYYERGLFVSRKTIQTMAKELDLTQTYVRKCIDTFLYN